MDPVLIIIIIIVIILLYNAMNNRSNNNEYMTLYNKDHLDEIPIFMINMAEREERKERAIRELDRNDLRVTFIEAVDGRHLDLDDLYNRGIIEDDPMDKPLRRGQIGCYLSHLKCWDKILETGKEYGLVLEDDAYFKRNFRKKFNDVFNELKYHDWDIINLGRRCDPYWFNGADCTDGDFIYSMGGVHAFYPRILGYGAHAYVIKRSTIEKLLKITYPIMRPIDVVIPDEYEKKNINVISFLKELVTVFDVDDSDTMEIE